MSKRTTRRADGRTMGDRQSIGIRTSRRFAGTVREFADELGVPASAVWVLGAALLISRDGQLGSGLPADRAKALVEDVRAQLSRLFP